MNAMPSARRPLGWPFVWYAAANAPLLLIVLAAVPWAIDWHAIADAPSAYLRGDLYRPGDVPYVWSPVFALLVAPLVPFGYLGWWLLHVAAVASLRRRDVIVMAAVSAGLWADAILGNTVTFAFVAGAYAIERSRYGTMAFIALCALMPRPAQFPLLLWIIVRRPEARVHAAAIVVVHAGAVLLTGYGEAWISALSSVGGQQMASGLNLSPTRFLGGAWLLIGLPLATVLTTRGYAGLAGLAMSPYLFPQHFLFALWRLPASSRATKSTGREARPAPKV